MLVRLLERHQRALRVVAIAACALSGARAIVHVVRALDGSSTAWASQTPPAGPVASPTAVAAPPPSKSGAALAERNPFCSACQPVAEATAAASDPDSSEPPATALPLHLIATHIAASDAGRSSAMVQDTTSNSQGAYRIGEPLPGAGPIVRIGGRSIDFENPTAGRVERLAIVQQVAPPARTEPLAEEPHDDTPPAHRRGRRSIDPELEAALDAGVKQIDDTHFEVQRGLIESVIARPQSASRGARVALRDGGLRLSRVRPDSAHARLGLKSGDTIVAVNGVELSSPDKMLEAVTRLRNESSISLSIQRRRDPMTLSYQIR